MRSRKVKTARPALSFYGKFVCVGAGIMILCLVIDLIKEIKMERAQKANASVENNNDTDVE